MKYENIPYEGSDQNGSPAMREARVIGELPYESRLQACIEATHGISVALGVKAIRSIPFGAPVYEAFGLTRQEAKAHKEAKLLLLLGTDVPLSHCG
jgi:hypothetical protein